MNNHNTQNARSICFSNMDNGYLRMAVHIDYFQEIGDIDAIIEEELLQAENGVRTREAAAEIIQSRLYLYMNE